MPPAQLPSVVLVHMMLGSLELAFGTAEPVAQPGSVRIAFEADEP